MYMNGRDPMGRGFGPMGGPMGGPMRHRPMGMGHRPMGFFPLGGLFLLPALMFGGWIAMIALGGILSVVGTILGGIFAGLSSLASGITSGGGIVFGIIIGIVLYFYIRRRKGESAGAEAE